MPNNRNVLKTSCTALNPIMLLFWVLLLWGGMYALRGYWEPDEARFVYVAREMVTSGNWLVPHRHGISYAQKPPLMFWLINVGETILPTPFGSRLPSLLGVLLSLWAMSGIAMLWRGRSTAIRSVIVLSSAWMFWETGGMGQIDALLLGLELSALYVFLKNDRFSPNHTPWIAFVLLGLGVMAKGPVGLIIPLGIYSMIRHFSKNEKHINFQRLGLGLLVSVSIPILWILACWLTGAPSEYLKELVFTQNVSRAAGELGHRRPIFYFLFHTPLAFMPWTLFLPVAFIKLRRNDPVFLRKTIGWVLFVVVFFTLPNSKRNIYILGALPGMALAIAAAWDDIEKNATCRIIATITLALATLTLGALTGIVHIGALPAIFKTKESISFFLASLNKWPFILTLLVAAAGLSLNLVAQRKWLMRYAISLSLIMSAVGFLIFPAFNNIKVPGELKPLAHAFIPEGGRLLLYDIYGETLALHAQRMGMRCDDDEAMTAAMVEQTRGLAVFLDKNTENLRERFPAVSDVGDFRMGSKKFVWCTFDTVKIPAQSRNSNPD